MFWMKICWILDYILDFKIIVKFLGIFALVVIAYICNVYDSWLLRLHISHTNKFRLNKFNICIKFAFYDWFCDDWVKNKGITMILQSF
jgi:hypothetical protein